MPVLPSTYTVNAVLNDIKSNSPVLALFTSNPGPTGTGTEVSGGSYARQAITFGAIASSQMQNSALITYTNMPAATITHYAIYTGSNMRVYGALPSNIITITGSEVRIAINAITVRLTGE